jgi:hypothetical protein
MGKCVRCLLRGPAELFHNHLFQSHERMKTPYGKMDQNEISCLETILYGLVENRLLFEAVDITPNADVIRAVRDRFEAEMSDNGMPNEKAVKVLAAFNWLIENFAKYSDLLGESAKGLKKTRHQVLFDGREKRSVRNGTEVASRKPGSIKHRKLDHRV